MYLLIIVSSFLLMSCNEKKDDNDKKKSFKVPVEVNIVGKGSISAYYSSSSTLESDRKANVVAKSSGYVQKIFVSEGDNVKEGQLLAELDNEKQILDLKSAEIEMDKATRDYQRATESFDRKYISDEVFEKIKYAYETAKNNYDQLQWAKNNTEIRASIDGKITSKLIDLGNMITSGSTAFMIEDFSTLTVAIDVPELELSKLSIGLEADVCFDALSEKVFKGKIFTISPVIDSRTGTSKVEIRVEDKKNILKPGMFARVKIEYDRRDNTILIPKNALLNEDDEKSVFIASDSLALKANVLTGYSTAEKIEILDGIKVGDQIVTIGVNSLKDSTKIEIIKIDNATEK